MKTEKLQSGNGIEPDQFVGTKWGSWKNLLGDRISVEFIDGENCIYTAKPKKYSLTYTIEEDKMSISSINGTFELRGSVLYNNDLPVFEKTA